MSIQGVLAVILVSLFLYWLISVLWNRRMWYIYSRKVPGPFAFPLIGALYLFIDSSPTAILNMFVKIQERYTGLCKLWYGPHLMYFVSKPEYIETLLTNRNAIEKNFFYDGITRTIGSGLLTARAKRWRKHRRLILPLFSQKRLESYVSIYSEQAKVLCNNLNDYVGRKNFDLFSLISRCTMDIILETSMGLKPNYQTTDSCFPKNFDRTFEIVALRCFNVWYSTEIIFNSTPLKKELEYLVQANRDVTTDIVEDKIKKYQLEESADVANEETSHKYESFLDLAIKTSHFSEEELREEIELFLSAGNDTTATSLTFLFEVLGLFQDVQHKLYEEVIEIMGKDQPIKQSNLPKLKYMERVIKENLRIFPVIPAIFRQVSEDIDLGDTVLPKGATLAFVALYIHRSPKFWPDPLKFDPDRFLPEEVAKRHPCSYIPFSYGPRNCIGGMYAMLNMKTILSTVIRKYKVFTGYKTIEDIKVKGSIFLRLQDGSKVSLELR